MRAQEQWRQLLIIIIKYKGVKGSMSTVRRAEAPERPKSQLLLVTTNHYNTVMMCR